MSSPPSLRASFSGSIGGFEFDFGFEAPLAGFTAVFGPSGSGKTSLLRCLAGLAPIRGTLHVGDVVWEDTETGLWRPPHERAVGYVFQEASLFAHLSVRDNLGFGHRRAIVRGPERIGPEGVIELLGLSRLLERSPHGLSGGERQRVALGRALLAQPELLLMDEPLAALDHAAKQEVLGYLEAIQDSLELPVVYVTHDLSEVERLADHVLLLESGRIVSGGPLYDVLVDPYTPLARSAAAASVLEARVVSYDPTDVLSTFETEAGRLLLPGDHGEVGTERRVRIAAQDVSLTLDPPSRTTILNVLPARVHEVVSLGSGRSNVVLRLGPDSATSRLLARVTSRSARTLELQAGTRVYAQIKAASIVDTGAPPA